ncbi:hypothetical protein THAOC_05977, partial [Thalassiosira oceanica]
AAAIRGGRPGRQSRDARRDREGILGPFGRAAPVEPGRGPVGPEDVRRLLEAGEAEG